MTFPDRLVPDGEVWPPTMKAAVHNEITMLWNDLAAARRVARSGDWSVGCESLTYRIVALSRLNGAVSWAHIDVDLTLSGLYQRIHEEAGLQFPAIDWELVARVKAGR